MKLTQIIAAGLTATLLTTSAPFAQTVPAEVQVIVTNETVAQMEEVMALVEELKAAGYTQIEIGRTMLGRAKVTAQGPDGTREVVMSTTTGEVMRDMMHGAEHTQDHGMTDGSHDGMADGMDGDNHDTMGGDNHDTMGDDNHDTMGDGNHDTMGGGNHDTMGGGMAGMGNN